MDLDGRSFGSHTLALTSLDELSVWALRLSGSHEVGHRLGSIGVTVREEISEVGGISKMANTT